MSRIAENTPRTDCTTSDRSLQVVDDGYDWGGELQQGDVDCKRICSNLGVAGKAGGFDVPTHEDDGCDVAGVD